MCMKFRFISLEALVYDKGSLRHRLNTADTNDNKDDANVNVNDDAAQ